MPELPEVEVTCRRMAPLLEGRQIRKVQTTRPSYLFITPPILLRRSLTGRTVDVLARRGKYLVAQLDDGARFVIHLGMTGQLFSDTAGLGHQFRGLAGARLHRRHRQQRFPSGRLFDP